MEYLVPILTGLSIITSLTTLRAVVRSRDKELEERIHRQNLLDNAIEGLKSKVTILIEAVDVQGEKLGKLQMDYALLFQEHRANHRRQER